MTLFIFSAVLLCFSSLGLSKEVNYDALVDHSLPRHPYSFSYAVKDPTSYSDFGHAQTSEGDVVRGEYKVALPDGRVQVVTYIADKDGYRADVKYFGKAHYPSVTPGFPVKAAGHAAMHLRKVDTHYPLSMPQFYPKSAVQLPTLSPHEAVPSPLLVSSATQDQSPLVAQATFPPTVDHQVSHLVHHDETSKVAKTEFKHQLPASPLNILNVASAIADSVHVAS